MKFNFRQIIGLESGVSPWGAELIREELFSAERLEQHAVSLAKAQAVKDHHTERALLTARLRDNERALLAACRDIAASVDNTDAITPAAEWLVDNFHLVEEQVGLVREDLPDRYYRQLPKLASGPFAGYPRVFGMAWAYIAHGDSRVDEQTLRRFVRAYQSVQALTLGELWAVAITLRVVLIENLRRAADRIVSNRIARQQADGVADQLLGVNGVAADVNALTNRYSQHDRLSVAFIVQLIKRLRDQDPKVMPAVIWLNTHVAAKGTTSDELVREEHQRQGASNVTVRNIITSMRLISDVNWPDFVEEVSQVDEVLRSASGFADMDFPTRNLYRGVIEELARGSARTEQQIAAALIEATRDRPAATAAERDPGYYLLGARRREFERIIGYRMPFIDRLNRLYSAFGPAGYIGAVVAVTAIVLLIPLAMLRAHGVAAPVPVALALLGLVPGSDVAVALINRALARGVRATRLPGLALRDGVPATLRTLVAVPTLLTTRSAIEAQIERLEVHYLASAYGEIHFALLSDWVDADSESTPEDDELLGVAVDAIARLNRLYPAASEGDRFYLFHRRRQWSDDQQRWIGWERKRGKLHELNRLLRGATDTSFVATGALALQVPQRVRYVVTLDSDTRLPRETIRRLVGKLAHPLNQPLFDAGRGRVVEGYAILQPRVMPTLPEGKEGSLFQRVYSSVAGIDPYAAAVSDVYQDLFGEGSYAGKGIYDVDAFEAALADRVPDATLLSHDLFEGTFARAGMASDIEVVEDFPSRYDVAAMRSHRWARGDWQLLPWILGRWRGGSRPMTLMGRWKMLDNLRRSLSAPTCLLALFAGWLLPWPASVLWSTFVVACIALPPSIAVLASIVPSRRGVAARSHWLAFRKDAWLAIQQILFNLAFLAHQSWMMADAIGRTLYRLTISRRNLLEWVTAAQTHRSPKPGWGGFYRRMGASVVIAALAIGVVGVAQNGVRWLAAPFIVLWLLAPALARRVSMSPAATGAVSVSATDAQALRLIARRTWGFFETFVTTEDHLLPPDNFQVDPHPVVAHRTSPTNIGLYLVCVVSARDFGWLSTRDAVERLAATLGSMHRLHRYRGHFYNWYDTRDLRPLEPLYVSSVDSGNLAAHLIVVANACREWVGTHPHGNAGMAGIGDALQLTHEALQALPLDRRLTLHLRHELVETIMSLQRLLRAHSESGIESSEQLSEFTLYATALTDTAQALASEQPDVALSDLLTWAHATRNCIESWVQEMLRTEEDARKLNQRLLTVELAARELAMEMDFSFLMNNERSLLSIGYRPTDGTLDPSCYDLLASEARLASFIAIAKNDVPARHWFRLGRTVTPVGHGAALISWSGSMFEYLMPALVMHSPVGSLIEQTNRLVVQRQMNYGDSLRVPWGISESAYNARDLELTYQYSNFGIPGLGLKRGLGENLVIAPYATGLAAMVNPQAAARNFSHLVRVGALGRYGFYEALDYTPSRIPDNATVAVVRAFMAHHQGMTLAAIANVIFDGRLRRRFHSEPNVEATELLLQERAPRDVSIAYPRATEVSSAARLHSETWSDGRRVETAQSPTPQTHLLSNGSYAVMLTSAGSGYSRWRDLAVTRWREDVTRDDSGSYLFLRDVQDGRAWSAGYQPCGAESESYEVTFTEDRAQFARRDGAIHSMLQVVVSPEDDAEVRRLSLTNSGPGSCELDITSYAELVLAPQAADSAHPAFSKMFVQTEYLPKTGTLLATRRRRSADEPEIWAAHQLILEGESAGSLEYETDRSRFLGRGNEINRPISVMDGRRLSNTVGTVLDPIFALRRRVRIPPGASVHLSFWTAVAASRSAVLNLIDKHYDPESFARAATLARTQAQVQLRHLALSPTQAHVFQQLASHVLYVNASLRASPDLLQSGTSSRTALWAAGVSGDLPIVLLRIDHLEDIAAVRELLQAHEYWQLKQLAIDVVILNERITSYVQDLQSALETLVRMSRSQPHIATEGIKGNVFVLRRDLISAETRATLSSVSRIVLVAERGGLAEQLDRRTALPELPARTPRVRTHVDVPPHLPKPGRLEFFNGMGGFAKDGCEYVTTVRAGQVTPAPWINVIANPGFGFQVSVEGGGYTWAINSRENQLTQWSNDPVSDRPGEVLYVRDDDTGVIWGPTVLPVGDEAAPYRVGHGQGYSRFEHAAYGIAMELLMYVPVADPIKICRLKLTNTSSRRRRLSVTAYVEWVLGAAREVSAPFIVTSIDAVSGALFARNSGSASAATHVAFMDMAGRQTQWTADRREFLGRHGRLDDPAGLARSAVWSRRTGGGLDPCGALQVAVALESGNTDEIVLFLGQTPSIPEAQALLLRYRTENLDAVLLAVIRQWDELLGTVQVKTPERSMDIMLNRWLLYQTLACRIWARAAFYQASGAYGFRDQLQDGMALVSARPALTREHLLRAAGRQFPRGDVQHWWLPPTGAGVRTRIADDRIWLAYAVVHYVKASADSAIFDELVPFIDGPEVPSEAHDAYYLPSLSAQSATLFEHCARGLDDSLATGVHALPLIGTGDWNDGMNRVGEKGRGESVWLAWFLHTTLSALATVASQRAEPERAARWRAHAVALSAALDESGWDGSWYRRGFFDDGTPYGSASSDECRIDAIAQSWAVISGAADPARAAVAMAAVDELLIRREDGLALLFTPPFDHTPLDPGYVKGYPPGLRENGGQYTHAATWSVIAFAILGRGDTATELFSLLNPIHHSRTRTGVRRYKVEPYVVAADVYSVAPHVGRGGWTWYTGSAGWLYRAGLEWILGFNHQATQLVINPCIPPAWPQFEILFKYRSACYEIKVENPDAVSRGIVRVTLDGAVLAGAEARIALMDDGATHQVTVTLGRGSED